MEPSRRNLVGDKTSETSRQRDGYKGILAGTLFYQTIFWQITFQIQNLERFISFSIFIGTRAPKGGLPKCGQNQRQIFAENWRY